MPDAALADSDRRVREAAANFNKEANELAKVAAAGDVAVVKAQLGKLQGTCKGCHQAHREKLDSGKYKIK